MRRLASAGLLDHYNLTLSIETGRVATPLGKKLIFFGKVPRGIDLHLFRTRTPAYCLYRLLFARGCSRTLTTGYNSVEGARLNTDGSVEGSYSESIRGLASSVVESFRAVCSKVTPVQFVKT